MRAPLRLRDDANPIDTGSRPLWRNNPGSRNINASLRIPQHLSKIQRSGPAGPVLDSYPNVTSRRLKFFNAALHGAAGPKSKGNHTNARPSSCRARHSRCTANQYSRTGGHFMTRQFHWLCRIVATSFAMLAFSLGSVALAANPKRPYRGSCSTVILPLTPPGMFPQRSCASTPTALSHTWVAPRVKLLNRSLPPASPARS